MAAAVASAFLAPSCWLSAVSAQEFPDHRIMMQIGFGAGGFPDISTRVLAAKMSDILAQPVVVENRAGASGNLASDFVARAKPDGYALGSNVDAQWGLAPWRFKTLSFDTEKDFTPVALFAISPIYVAVGAKVPVSNFNELVQLMKDNPGKYSFGTPGAGTTHHLMFETALSKLGVRATHVPYKASPEVMSALLGGEVQIAVQGYAQLKQYAESGAIKVLATGSAKRTALAPQVPTFRELGVDIVFDTASGIVAPANLPAAVLAKLSAAVQKSVMDSDTAQRLTAAGAQVQYEDPATFAARIHSDIAKYKEAVALTGIEPQ